MYLTDGFLYLWPVFKNIILGFISSSSKINCQWATDTDMTVLDFYGLQIQVTCLQTVQTVAWFYTCNCKLYFTIICMIIQILSMPSGVRIGSNLNSLVLFSQVLTTEHVEQRICKWKWDGMDMTWANLNPNNKSDG